MAKMRSGKGEKRQSNAAAVSVMVPKTETIETIVEVEKIVQVHNSTNMNAPLSIDMNQVAGFNDAMIQVRQDCRQDMANLATKLKKDMTSDKAQFDAKIEEVNDMAESTVAQMDADKKSSDAAMLVLNAQIGQIGKELEKQIKISIGVGVLLLTTIIVGLIL